MSFSANVPKDKRNITKRFQHQNFMTVYDANIQSRPLCAYIIIGEDASHPVV